MNSPEHPEILTAESVRSVKNGLLSAEHVDELLEPTAWTRQRRSTQAGTVHVFSRPVTLLESIRINPKDFQDGRRSLGFENQKEDNLLFLVLREPHREDILQLSSIEKQMRGERRIGRETFTGLEQRVIDWAWLYSDEIAAQTGLTTKTVSTNLDRARSRVGVETRAELLVLGLKEGFFNPPLENWKRIWPDVKPYQAKVLPFAHHNAPVIAELLGQKQGSINGRFTELYKLTGTKTRIELILVALANRAVRLEQFDQEIGVTALSKIEQDLLSHVERPVLELADIRRVAPKTIDWYFKRIQEKLGLPGKFALVSYAINSGYVSIEKDESLADTFTHRQQEVAYYLGRSNVEIAEILGISYRTVDSHLTRMRARTNLTRNELIAFAAKAGLLDSDYPKPRA